VRLYFIQLPYERERFAAKDRLMLFRLNKLTPRMRPTPRMVKLALNRSEIRTVRRLLIGNEVSCEVVSKDGIDLLPPAVTAVVTG
jgi:hypothetical protein